MSTSSSPWRSCGRLACRRAVVSSPAVASCRRCWDFPRRRWGASGTSAAGEGPSCLRCRSTRRPSPYAPGSIPPRPDLKPRPIPPRSCRETDPQIPCPWVWTVEKDRAPGGRLPVGSGGLRNSSRLNDTQIGDAALYASRVGATARHERWAKPTRQTEWVRRGRDPGRAAAVVYPQAADDPAEGVPASWPESLSASTWNSRRPRPHPTTATAKRRA